MSKPKKKFKDTKVGKFLLGSGSKIADVVGDLLPSSGVLGIVKNLMYNNCYFVKLQGHYDLRNFQ